MHALDGITPACTAAMMLLPLSVVRPGVISAGLQGWRWLVPPAHCCRGRSRAPARRAVGWQCWQRINADLQCVWRVRVRLAPTVNMALLTHQQPPASTKPLGSLNGDASKKGWSGFAGGPTQTVSRGQSKTSAGGVTHSTSTHRQSTHTSRAARHGSAGGGVLGERPRR